MNLCNLTLHNCRCVFCAVCFCVLGMHAYTISISARIKPPYDAPLVHKRSARIGVVNPKCAVSRVQPRARIGVQHSRAHLKDKSVVTARRAHSLFSLPPRLFLAYPPTHSGSARSTNRVPLAEGLRHKCRAALSSDPVARSAPPCSPPTTILARTFGGSRSV